MSVWMILAVICLYLFVLLLAELMFGSAEYRKIAAPVANCVLLDTPGRRLKMHRLATALWRKRVATIAMLELAFIFIVYYAFFT